MRYDNLVMFGKVYRKKQPNEWEMNGQKGTTYALFVDTYEACLGIGSDAVSTLKVSEEIYNQVDVNEYVAFEVSVNIDEKRDANNDRSGLQVRRIISTGNSIFSILSGKQSPASAMLDTSNPDQFEEKKKASK